MNRKKLWTIIVAFALYCAVLIVISVNNRNNKRVEANPVGNSTVESSMEKDTTESNANEYIDGKTETKDDADDMSDRTKDESLTDPLNLLSADAFASATVEGKTGADTPWGSNIALLGKDDSEQGLLILPGTSVIYTVQIPEGKMIVLHISAKLFESIAETGVSDGSTIVVDVLQGGNSLKTYDQIVVSGDGRMSEASLDLSEWQGRTVQIRIRSYDGGNNNADGDWCIIRELKLSGK